MSVATERAIWFGVCALAYVVAHLTRRMHRLPVLLLAGALVAILLVVAGPSHRTAFHAAISPFLWLLGPMTVALAVPLERARRRSVIPIARASSVLVTSAVGGVLFIVAIAKLFSASKNVCATLAPRAATSALSVPTADALGGSAATTSLVVALSGVAIAVVGPRLLMLLGVKDAVSRGLALGSAGHLVATARAYEESEAAGAAASFALAVHGVATVLACFALRFLGML